MDKSLRTDRAPVFLVRMDHFGKFIRRLREARGLTRLDVVQMTGLRESTLVRAEARPDCVMHRKNLIRLFTALQQTAPLAVADAAVFMKSTGLTDINLHKRATDPRSHTPQTPEHDRATAAALADAMRHMDPRKALAFRRLVQITDLVGVEHVLPLLDALEIFATSTAGLAESIRPQRQELRIVTPPVNRGHYIEQVFRTYEVPEEQRPPQKAKKIGG